MPDHYQTQTFYSTGRRGQARSFMPGQSPSKIDRINMNRAGLNRTHRQSTNAPYAMRVTGMNNQKDALNYMRTLTGRAYQTGQSNLARNRLARDAGRMAGRVAGFTGKTVPAHLAGAGALGALGAGGYHALATGNVDGDIVRPMAEGFRTTSMIGPGMSMLGAGALDDKDNKEIGAWKLDPYGEKGFSFDRMLEPIAEQSLRASLERVPEGPGAESGLIPKAGLSDSRLADFGMDANAVKALRNSISGGKVDFSKVQAEADARRAVGERGPLLRPVTDSKGVTTLRSVPEGSKEERSVKEEYRSCLLYTSPSPRDLSTSRMPSSA